MRLSKLPMVHFCDAIHSAWLCQVFQHQMQVGWDRVWQQLKACWSYETASQQIAHGDGVKMRHEKSLHATAVVASVE